LLGGRSPSTGLYDQPDADKPGVEIAGTSVREGYLLELATILRSSGSDEAAGRLADAILADKKRVNLSVDDREAILSVLFDPPNSELAALRGVLLDRAWRHANGL